MNSFLIGVLILLSLFLVFQLWLYLKTKRSIGKDIVFDNLNEELVNKIRDQKGMVYFYSPSCYNCKLQTPIIENLKKKLNNVISINASQNLMVAKTFNVMGTPSIVFFSGNKIVDYFVGIKQEMFLTEKLNNL